MLTFDPNDGRETGLRLPRHTPAMFPEMEPSQHGFALNGVIREMCDQVAEKVGDHALLAHALGLRLEYVGATATVETEGDRCAWKMSATYRVTREAEPA